MRTTLPASFRTLLSIASRTLHAAIPKVLTDSFRADPPMQQSSHQAPGSSADHVVQLMLLASLAIGMPAGCQKGGSGLDSGTSLDPIGNILASVPDLAPPPEFDDHTQVGDPYYPGGGLVCQMSERSVGIASIDRPQLADHGDVIWPGSAVQGISLSEGIPSMITAPRGAGDVVISNFTQSPSDSWRHLAQIGLGPVTQAINEIVNAQPDDFPADLRLSVSQIHNLEELQLALQASGSYFDIFSADLNFHFQDSVLVNKFLVTLEQNFFSIAFARPDRIRDFFAPGTTVADLETQVYPGNPAGYISQVTYGRVFYLLVQTTTEATQARGVLEANFLDLAEASGDIQYTTQLENRQIEAYAYGGLQSEVLDSVEAGLGSLTTFIQSLDNANDVLAAKPLSYIVRGIATDHVWKNGINAEYEYSDCSLVGDCVPTLYTPSSEASLDNGCAVFPDLLQWTFDWSDCNGAEEYELQVLRGAQVYVDQFTPNSTDVYATTGVLPVGPWQWKVRAKRYGAWNPWSTAREFTLEEPNTDCATKVRVYTHPNEQGDFTDFTTDIANLEDVPGGMDDDIDSLRLYNIRGVWLFEHPDYQGASFYFDHDCPDVELHAPHAGNFRKNWASSLRIVF